MLVGLGTGTTASAVIRVLGKRVRDEGLKILGVPTSVATAELVVELAEHVRCDPNRFDCRRSHLGRLVSLNRVIVVIRRKQPADHQLVPRLGAELRYVLRLSGEITVQQPGHLVQGVTRVLRVLHCRKSGYAASGHANISWLDWFAKLPAQRHGKEVRGQSAGLRSVEPSADGDVVIPQLYAVLGTDLTYAPR